MKYDVRDIMSAASSLAVFKKGNDYYKQDRIKRCTYAPDLERIYAKVEGSENYHVDIRLDDGFIDDAYCDCRGFHEYPGFCKHIVAALLYAKLNYQVEPETIEISSILDYYMDQDFDTAEGYQKLSVVYVLTIDESLDATLSIKIGQEQLYVLKEPLKFLSHLEDNYAFGKKFEYDPFVHCFEEKDLELFDFLRSVLISYQTFNEKKLQYKNIDKKDIELSDYHLKEFLMKVDDITLKHRSYDNIVDVVYEDIQPEIVIEQDEETFKLFLTDLKSYYPLNKAYSIFRHEDKIHLISEQQKKEWMPLFQMLSHKFDQVDIKSEDLHTFMSYMYPVLERTGQVTLSESLSDKLEKYPCKSELYLDLKHGDITADLKYNYGPYTFDTFSQDEQPEDTFICRDLKQENHIMHILESSAFKVSKKGYYMDDEMAIYQFLSDKLPALQKYVTVYYSDAFKRLEVKDYDSLEVHSSLDESGDFFSFEFALEGIDPNEMNDLIDHIKQEKKYYRLKDGSFLSLDDPYFEALTDMLNDLELEAKDFKDGAKRLPTYLSFYFNETLGKTAIMDDKLKAIVEAPEKEIYELPNVQAELRNYQVTGFNWLKSLSKYGFGGILADDMGLGKTIQTLSYIKSEIDDKEAVKILIVAPTSLMYNWMNEVNKFFVDIDAIIVDGTKEQRKNKLENLEHVQVVITSYAMVRNDIEVYKEKHFDICVLDEAQHIKNPISKTAKAVKSLDVKRKFALTGTPIENRLLELWSIFDFIMPQYLGNMTRFKAKHELPIKNGEVTNLKQLVQPFIMRRLKSDVLKELPEKIENKLVVDLTEDQKKVYVAHLNRYRDELKTIYQNQGYEKSQMKTLAALTRLRQICLHPGMFLDKYEGESSKLNLLKELLEELMDGQHRMLIFSQFTSMLERIKTLLKQMNIDFYYLDGSTKAIERNRLVGEYNQGSVPVFLISLKAGGTGLNLTGADTVIHMDPWWNPAVEEQATDRAHRIGQKKAVHVIKMVTKGTIEEKIYALQERKKALINQVIKPGETFITGLSEREILELFK